MVDITGAGGGTGTPTGTRVVTTVEEEGIGVTTTAGGARETLTQGIGMVVEQGIVVVTVPPLTQTALDDDGVGVAVLEQGIVVVTQDQEAAGFDLERECVFVEAVPGADCVHV
ncbi:hypothetical protein PG993_012366 [Apiospora rasikravindrae]|uniref:Uncharacterized protein n=1 Tax=Apiospora rasikravindrae TaxID=990691 RepID=A0ABR1S287_9PEZI